MTGKSTSLIMTKPSVHPAQHNNVERANISKLKHSETAAPVTSIHTLSNHARQNSGGNGNTDNFNVLETPSAAITSKASIDHTQGNPPQKESDCNFNTSQTGAARTTTSPQSSDTVQ